MTQPCISSISAASRLWPITALEILLSLSTCAIAKEGKARRASAENAPGRNKELRHGPAILTLIGA